MTATATDRTRPRRRRHDPPTASGHIAGLDGLRAVAVGIVVVFHLWPERLPGGFLGVDVFFVISGFLITTLLLREHERDGGIDLVGFWTRRARRLLPALFLVVGVSVVVAHLVARDLLVDIERQVLGAFTFSTNWVEIGAGTDYFDHANDTLLNPLWSLAVEEQFYLLWPLAFSALALVGVSMSARARLVTAAAVASAALMAILHDPAFTTRVYYGTDTHLFGLMLGAGAAFAFFARGSRLAGRQWERLRLWTGFAGLAGVLAFSASMGDTATVTYRGGMLAACLCALVAVVALPGQPSAYTRLLETEPLRWIGQRSYGIYLWHWPAILVVAELRPATPPGTPTPLLDAAIAVAVTAVASELSFRYVETPVRVHGYRGTWHRVRDALAPDRARSPRPIPRIAALAGLLLVVGATAGVASAPDRTSAQRTVEAGQDLIDSQRPSATTPTPSSTTTAPADTAPAPTSPPPTTPAPTAPPPTAEPAWPAALPAPPGDRMTGMGDSVLSAAAPAMFQRFPGIHMAAEPNLQWRDAPDLVRRLDASGLLRPVVVLNFGTNAGLKDQTSRDAMREVLELLGPERRVIVVTVVGISYWVEDTNRLMADIVSGHPNAVLADWHTLVQGRPELLDRDRTHPTMAGIAVYAELVEQAAVELGPGA